MSQRGGIGIHRRLKISRPYGLAGSSPASGTKKHVRDIMDEAHYIIIFFLIFIGIPLLGVLAAVFDLLIS